MVIQFSNGTNVWCFDEPQQELPRQQEYEQQQQRQQQQHGLQPSMPQYQSATANPAIQIPEMQPQSTEPMPSMVMQFANGVNLWYMANERPTVLQPSLAEEATSSATDDQRASYDTENDVISISDEEEAIDSRTYEIRTDWI